MLLASIRLTAQGVNQDELHQAAGAFAWRGGPILNYVAMKVRGLPVLNMTYSGAIKTALYGLFLRFSGREFSVVSWRAVGILTGGAALFLFFRLVGLRWPPLARILFALLVLSDSSILLLHRHDYGPVAIGFFLRLLFLGICLRRIASPHEQSLSFFWLGSIAGLAAFEKLSSLVLLLPLALAVVVLERKTIVRRIAAAGLGLLIGALPLILINLDSFKHSGRWISFSNVEKVDHSFGSLARYSGALLSLGSGARAREFLLGVPARPVSQWLEGLTLAVLLVLSFAGALRRQRGGPQLRLALFCAVSFILVGLGTWLLPAKTDIHHWVLATPFQYAALALAVSSLTPFRRGPTWPLIAGIVAGSIFLANRTATLVATTKALVEGKASGAYDPSLTQIGEFARRSGSEAAFIAADWGVSAPMFCLSNGPRRKVFEPYWFYGGPAELEPILRLRTKSVFYAVVLRPVSGVRPFQTEHLLEDLTTRPDLLEVDPEAALKNLAVVKVRKFVRRKSSESGR